VRVGATGDTIWRFGVPFCTNLHVREEAVAVAVVWRFSLAARMRSVGRKADGVWWFFLFACDCFKYPTSFSVG
jgi:hypothetical protein